MFTHKKKTISVFTIGRKHVGKKTITEAGNHVPDSCFVPLYSLTKKLIMTFGIIIYPNNEKNIFKIYREHFLKWAKFYS